MTTYPRDVNFERIIFVYGFRDISLWSFGSIACGRAEHHSEKCMVEQSYLPHVARKQRKRGRRSGSESQYHLQETPSWAFRVSHQALPLLLVSWLRFYGTFKIQTSLIRHSSLNVFQKVAMQKNSVLEHGLFLWTLSLPY